MGRLRDFFHWAVGEFTRAETTLLFVHVAATRLHALTLPRSIRNESVATLSQNTGPGLCSRKELKSSLDKEKRFWFLHLVPFSYAGEREESIQRMTTSLHSAKKSCRLPKTDTSISLAQSDTDTKGCHDSPQTSNGHLPWINWCAYPSNHTQLEQNCSCLIFVQGRQLIQNREDVWKSMQDVWLSRGITKVSAKCRQQETWSDHSNWMTYSVCSAWRKQYFTDGLNTAQVSY